MTLLHTSATAPAHHGPRPEHEPDHRSRSALRLYIEHQDAIHRAERATMARRMSRQLQRQRRRDNNTTSNNDQEDIPVWFQRLLQDTDEEEENVDPQLLAAEQQQPVKPTVPPASCKFVSKLPRARILRTDKQQFAHDETECNICFSRLIDGICLVRLPCGHLYHFNCAFQWLASSCTCPECRYELPTADYKFETERVKRMEKRKTVACDCKAPRYHECFFRDPSKSLREQQLVDVESMQCLPATSK